jgi:hypothetical protein
LAVVNNVAINMGVQESKKRIFQFLTSYFNVITSFIWISIALHISLSKREMHHYPFIKKLKLKSVLIRILLIIWHIVQWYVRTKCFSQFSIVFKPVILSRHLFQKLNKKQKVKMIPSTFLLVNTVVFFLC